MNCIITALGMQAQHHAAEATMRDNSSTRQLAQMFVTQEHLSLNADNIGTTVMLCKPQLGSKGD